jgi:hypothetical protein
MDAQTVQKSDESDDLATRLFERGDDDSVAAGNIIDTLQSLISEFETMVRLHGPDAINPRWLCGRLGLWGTFRTEPILGDLFSRHLVHVTLPQWLLDAEAAQA